MTTGNVTRYRLIDGRYRVVHDDPPSSDNGVEYCPTCGRSNNNQPSARTITVFDYDDPAWRQLPEWGGSRD